MAKEATLNIRMSADERAALERAAADDDRPPSTMARKIIVEWLRAQERLPGKGQDAKTLCDAVFPP